MTCTATAITSTNNSESDIFSDDHDPVCGYTEIDRERERSGKVKREMERDFRKRRQGWNEEHKHKFCPIILVQDQIIV